MQPRVSDAPTPRAPRSIASSRPCCRRSSRCSSSIVAGDLLILAVGQSPGAVYRLLLDGTWGNAYGFGQVLYKTTTLICTGLAVAVGLRAGLFNIGAEGQLAAGGFAAALVGLALPVGTPALVAVPLCTSPRCCAGGAVRIRARRAARASAARTR